MKLIDTDVLIRFFTWDNEAAESISDLFRAMERKKEKLLVTEEVIIELVYYLESVLGWERKVVGDIINTILFDALFKVERKGVIGEAVRLYVNTDVPFLDCVKVAKARYGRISEAVSFNYNLEKGGIKTTLPSEYGRAP